MNAKRIENNHWVIRLARGETVVGSLTSFCKKHALYGGFFYGLGAIDNLEIAHYNVTTKKYASKTYREAFEVTNITGSIGIEEKTKNVIIHAHITVTDNHMRAFGGHLVEARVSGTLELYLVSLPPLAKVYDKETGLKVFDFT